MVAGFTFGQFWPLSSTQFLKTAYALYAEELKYQLCGDAFVMALIYQGAWNGYYNCLYPIGKEWVPAMVILLGNRLTDEELKNPEMFDKKIIFKN